MENGHITTSHKPLVSMFQEDHMAFCQDLDLAAVQSLTSVASLDTCKISRVSWLSHFLSVEAKVILFLLIMSATHAEKNRMEIRERVVKWNRRLTVMSIVCYYCC